MTILLVDDGPGDVRLTRKALCAVDRTSNSYVVSDGAQADSVLRRNDRHADAPRPELILLDLNLPKISGYRVLTEIKQDDRLKTIPTATLTTTSEVNIDVVYKLRANGLLANPAELDAFESVLKRIRDLWPTRAMLPPELRAA